MKTTYNTKVFNYLDGQHIELFKRSVSKHSTDSEQMRQIEENIRRTKELINDTVTDDVFNAAEQFKQSDQERTQEQIDHCLSVSMNRTKRQIYHIARSNEWDYFITITIDRKQFNAADYDLTIKKLTTFLNNIRKRKAPDLKYLIVPELHADKKNYHFHGMLANTGSCSFIQSGHYDDNGEIIYNWTDWKYGFTTATQIKDNGRVSSYITKYITKDTAQILKNKKRYYCSKNITRVEPELLNIPTDKFIEECGADFDYIKTVTIPGALQKVRYVEINNKN